MPPDSTSLYHTIVRVGPDGSVDTSTYAAYGYGGTAAAPNAAMHTAAYVTATASYYVGAGPGTGAEINANDVFASGYGGEEAGGPVGSRGRIRADARARTTRCHPRTHFLPPPPHPQ